MEGLNTVDLLKRASIQWREEKVGRFGFAWRRDSRSGGTGVSVDVQAAL